MIRPNRSDCSDYWHDKIADYVLGNLSPEETAALQEQLAVNSNLAHELAELQESLATLPYTLPEAAPSINLKASILEAAQAKKPQHTQDEPIQPATSVTAETTAQTPHQAWHPISSLTLSRKLPWKIISGAIAATVLLALGLDNYRLRQQVQSNLELKESLRQSLEQREAELERLQDEVQRMTTVVASLQEPESIVYTLKGTGLAEGATGRLVTTPGHQDMVLVSEDLPPLTENYIYRLWAIADAANQPEYCGQFRMDTEGTGHWTAPTETCSQTPTQLLITLDQPNDPIDSAGPLVMESQT